MVNDVVCATRIKVVGERAPRGRAFSHHSSGICLGGRDPGILATAREERQADRHTGRDIVAEPGIAALVGQVDTKIGTPAGIGYAPIGIRLPGLGIDHLDGGVAVASCAQTRCVDRKIEDRSGDLRRGVRSEEHTSELQPLLRNSYAVFYLKKKKYH